MIKSQKIGRKIGKWTPTSKGLWGLNDRGQEKINCPENNVCYNRTNFPFLTKDLFF